MDDFLVDYDYEEKNEQDSDTAYASCFIFFRSKLFEKWYGLWMITDHSEQGGKSIKFNLTEKNKKEKDSGDASYPINN